jgi:hypothetical protein
VVAEVPLLFEAGWADLFDVTITLLADAELRHRRTEHLHSDMDFAMREALQLTDERRRELADYFFVNDGDKTALAGWAGRILEQVRADHLGSRYGDTAAGTVPLAVDVLELARTAATAREAGEAAAGRLSGEVFESAGGLSGGSEARWEYLPAGAGYPESGFEQATGEILIVLQGVGARLLVAEDEPRVLAAGTAVRLQDGARYQLKNGAGEAPLILLRFSCP